jgi:hypothetical protein
MWLPQAESKEIQMFCVLVRSSACGRTVDFNVLLHTYMLQKPLAWSVHVAHDLWIHERNCSASSMSKYKF